VRGQPNRTLQRQPNKGNWGTAPHELLIDLNQKANRPCKLTVFNAGRNVLVRCITINRREQWTAFPGFVRSAFMAETENNYHGEVCINNNRQAGLANRPEVTPHAFTHFEEIR
jgi:hypothetical protein